MENAEDSIPFNVSEESEIDGVKLSRETKIKPRSSLTSGNRTTHNHRGYDVLAENGEQDTTREYQFPDSPTACDYVLHPVRWVGKLREIFSF